MKCAKETSNSRNRIARSENHFDIITNATDFSLTELWSSSIANLTQFFYAFHVIFNTQKKSIIINNRPAFQLFFHIKNYIFFLCVEKRSRKREKDEILGMDSLVLWNLSNTQFMLFFLAFFSPFNVLMFSGIWN